MTTQTKLVQLEPDAQAFADATSTPPFAFQLPPTEGRKAVDQVQAGDIAKLPVTIDDRMIEGGPDGDVSIRILRPQNAPETLPVIVYTHGGGWVFGNNHTHDRLIRELAVGANAAVVFPNYTPSPEAKYPKALEECYAVVKWVAENGRDFGFDAKRIIVAGDSAGGCITAAITLLAKERGEPSIMGQLLFYPVTDANFDTESYYQFAEGYFLRRDGMMWFWDQYAPDHVERDQITASPLRASIDQLRDLPPTLIITAEADVLRDEGEAYGNKLREADVPVTAVRFQGILHDFVMLNAMASTNATRSAMLLATSWLRDQFSQ